MPPCASSNTPGRRWSAPVKAPRSWPKSSLSISVAGMAAQLMATNGLSRRGERLWMARATSSLPVPDSPVMATLALAGATFSMSSNTRRIALELRR